MQEMNEKPVFNHDLLINPNDFKRAYELYGRLADALHHPELIEWFKPFDKQANVAKSSSLTVGSLAILFGATSIFLATVDVAIRALHFGDVHDLMTIGGIAGAFGVIGAAFGVFGVLWGRRKDRWLKNRFMGERIRQFHFQCLLAQLPLILAMVEEKKSRTQTDSAEPDATKVAQQEFLKDRDRRFIKFQREFEELGKTARFRVTVHPNAEPHSENEWKLCEQSSFLLPAKCSALPMFFEAYEDLRFKYQLNYANYKQSSDIRYLSDKPLRQTELLASVSKFCIWMVVLVNLCAVVIILSWLVGWFGDQTAAPVVTGIFALAAIILAVVNLCAHAFAQGLQPEREVERYQQYGSAVSSLMSDFKASSDPMEKVRIMWQMERAAFLEMQNFLITQERSSFAM